MSTNESKADEYVDYAPRRVATRSQGRPPENNNIEINLEKQKIDELFHLKKSKAGHLGYLNKVYNTLEDLMNDPCNLNQVKSSKQTLDEAFDNCLHAHKKYIIHLDEPRQQSSAFEAYEDIINRKKEFDEFYQQWINKFGISSGFDIANKSLSSTSNGSQTLSRADVQSITKDIHRLESRYDQLLEQTKLRR